MNEIERDKLYERYLLNEATDEERKQVIDLITTNEKYKAEFESQKKLIGIIHNAKRSDLKAKFSQIQNELEEEEKIAIKPLEIIKGGSSKSFWEQNYFRYAASVIGVLLIGYGIWTITKPTDTIVVIKKDDSTQNVIDTNKVLPNIENQNPIITKNTQLKGKMYLPTYEDSGLGFAKDKKYTDSILVVFRKSDTPQYKFKDTLIISTPKPLINNAKWKILFDRENGQYILSNSKTEYVLEKGSSDEKPLKMKE